MGSGGEPAIRSPAVADDHAGEVFAEQIGGLRIAASGLDLVDGPLGSRRDPQPVEPAGDLPAGFVRRDDGTVADLMLQGRIGWLRVQDVSPSAFSSSGKFLSSVFHPAVWSPVSMTAGLLFSVMLHLCSSSSRPGTDDARSLVIRHTDARNRTVEGGFTNASPRPEWTRQLAKARPE